MSRSDVYWHYKSEKHLFPSCLFESLSDFPVTFQFLPYFTYEADSQRTYCTSFDRMLVYRQLSAGIAKFRVSVGEIESSLRGNVLGVFAESDSYWFSYQRNLITEDVVYVASRELTHMQWSVSKLKRDWKIHFGLIIKLLST